MYKSFLIASLLFVAVPSFAEGVRIEADIAQNVFVAGGLYVSKSKGTYQGMDLEANANSLQIRLGYNF